MCFYAQPTTEKYSPKKSYTIMKGFYSISAPDIGSGVPPTLLQIARVLSLSNSWKLHCLQRTHTECWTHSNSKGSAPFRLFFAWRFVFTFLLITTNLLKRAAKITPETLYVLNISHRTVTSDNDVIAFEPVTKLLYFIKFFHLRVVIGYSGRDWAVQSSYCLQSVTDCCKVYPRTCQGGPEGKWM